MSPQLSLRRRTTGGREREREKSIKWVEERGRRHLRLIGKSELLSEGDISILERGGRGERERGGRGERERREGREREREEGGEREKGGRGERGGRLHVSTFVEERFMHVRAVVMEYNGIKCIIIMDHLPS